MIIKKNEVKAMDFNGLSIFDYTAKLKERSSFAIIQVPPRISHRLSWSKRSDKYYYVIEGKIDFTINDHKYPLTQGDFCIVKKGDKFNYINASGKMASLVLIHTPNFKLSEEVFK